MNSGKQGRIVHNGKRKADSKKYLDSENGGKWTLHHLPQPALCFSLSSRFFFLSKKTDFSLPLTQALLQLSFLKKIQPKLPSLASFLFSSPRPLLLSLFFKTSLAPAPFLPFLPLPILKARTSLMFLLNQQASPSALAFSPSSSPPLSVTLQLPKDSSFLPVSLFFHKPSPALLFTHQQHGFFPQQHGLLALLLPVQSGFPPAEKGVPPSLFQKEMQISKKKTLPRVPHKRGLQICLSSVELTSARNVNTEVKSKCE